MNIAITVTEEDFLRVTEIALVSMQHLFKLIDVAQSLNMKCIPFIDLDDYTIFNENHCIEIKKELAILRTYEDVNADLINILDQLADEVLGNMFYCLVIFTTEKDSIVFDPS